MKNVFSKYGFEVISEQEVPDTRGTLIAAEHKKSGARLHFLDREDRNLTFAISFRTPPTNDTGVFHIIEHSVLCGSRKFPVKEPFVELLKGSLNTFLNALTYEDRTVYPVSSRCEKDFLNLTDVYLDAVFHPRMLSDENVFLQEGWHYEYDGETDTLSYNGVVYNEMCGAYSSPEEVAENELRAGLFPDTVYSRDSGGNPDFIPELTYSQLKEAHATYYHPSNAEIFIDGSIDLDKTLSLIACYLEEYDRTDINITYPLQAPVCPPVKTVEFEPGGDPLARVLFGYVYSSPETKNQDYALSVLDSTIAGTNESDLKKAMLATELCEDIVTSVYRARQTQYTIEVIGVKPENIDIIAPTLEGIIREIAKRGINRERLSALINNDEFKQKEFDGGSIPKGTSYALTAFSFLNFGFSAAAALTYSDDIEFSRERLNDTDYYENLLLSATVDNPHQASVVMLPKEDLEKERAAKKRELLKKIRQTLSDSELDDIIKKQKKLAEIQSTPDSPENEATLPKLALSDIEPKLPSRKSEISKIDGTTVLSHGIDSGDITHLTLCFAANDLSDSEILDASLLSALLKNLPSKSRTAISLQNDIKANLGALTFGFSSSPLSDGSAAARLNFTVSASALSRKKSDIPRLISEILLTTDFSKTKTIEKTLIQLRSAMDEALTADSLSFALTRVTASLTAAGRTNELTTGYTAYKSLVEMTKNTEDSAKRLSESLPALLRRLVCKERLTVSLASADSELTDKILAFIPSAENVPACAHEPRKARPEKIRHGITVPARVSYACMGALSKEAARSVGLLRVVRSILSYEYLWNEVRVKGGAYGTGFIVRKTGEIGFYSYRDPSPESTLGVYRSAPAFLRSLAEDECDLTKFIIGAYGEYDIMTTPKSEAAQALYDYMTGWTDADERALTDGILNVTPSALRRAADIIEEAIGHASIAVIGEKEKLAAFAEPLVLNETLK